MAFAHAGDQVYVAGVENVIKVRRSTGMICFVRMEVLEVAGLFVFSCAASLPAKAATLDPSVVASVCCHKEGSC